MSDAVEIRGLRVLGIHGVLDEEQQRSQPFELDLVLETPLAAAAAADDLSATVDYGGVAMAVRDLVASAHYQLIETLAEAVANQVLEDARIEAVTVTVRKLRPPIAADVDTVGVRLTRRRGESMAGAAERARR